MKESGLGECFFAPGFTSILRSLEPLLIGEDPRDIHRLFRKLQLATSGAGSVAGIIYNAISGIEAALWDVLGQWLDVPIYRLLGGKFRDQVRIYADCHGGEALESWTRCCVPAQRLGNQKAPHMPQEITTAKLAKSLLLRPTNIAVRLSKRGRKDSQP